MRIVQLMSNPGMGGTETFAIGLGIQLDKLGARVRVINVSQGGGLLAEACRESGVEFSSPNSYVCQSWRRCRNWLINELESAGPEIVMGYGYRISMAMRFMPCRQSRPRMIVGLRGLEVEKSVIQACLDRATQNRIDCFVAVSKAVREKRISRERTPEDRLVCIENGIDTVRFDRENWMGCSPVSSGISAEGAVVTVGNCRMEKGYDFLLDAISEHRHLLEGVKFIWIGDGFRRSGLEAEVLRRGLGNEIAIVEECRDVRPYLARAGMFVMPSRSEGMPRALMEAMSMQLPCIATDVGGIGEVVQDGRTGLLIPFGDKSAMVGAILSLRDDGRLSRRLGENARRAIFEKFSIEEVARRYMRLFQSLCSV